MVSRLVFPLLFMGFFLSPAHALSPSTFPCLPKTYREAHFQKAEAGFKARAELSLPEESVHLWTFNRPTKDILKEFDALIKWRRKLWFKDPSSPTPESQDGFMIAQPLLFNHRYRNPSIIAFEYNHTDDSYNSSSINLNGLRFLAFESPSEDSVEALFHLLYNFQITHLVRLTAAAEDGIEKSYPYWKGHEDIDPVSERTYLHVPLKSWGSKQAVYTIPYTWTDRWKDNHAISPERLFALILKARKDYGPSSLIGVHCHSGSGRTGVFIAGFALLHEVDRQIAKGKKLDTLDISIEEVAKKLDLQRFTMIQVPQQYLLLYRLVDFYVKNLKSNPRFHKEKLV